MNFLELRIPPVAQVLLVGAAMWALDAASPDTRVALPAARWLALGIGTSGVTMALLGVLAFRKAQTTVDPRVPQQSEHLVVTGIYAISRNPMYVAFFLMLAAWAIHLQQILNLALLALFVAYISRFQIIPEERFLRAKFAEEFDAYGARVRRWL